MCGIAITVYSYVFLFSCIMVGGGCQVDTAFNIQIGGSAHDVCLRLGPSWLNWGGGVLSSYSLYVENHFLWFITVC